MKREEAEYRNSRYQGMTLEQKLDRNSDKVKQKLVGAAIKQKGAEFLAGGK